MDVPLIDRVKIQAQVLVPLIQELRNELGRDRADALVRRSLGDLYRRLGEEWWRSRKSGDVGANMAASFAGFAKGDALEYSVRRQSPDDCAIDVTKCRYAEFYRKMGEPELGFLLVCSLDFPFAEGFGTDVTLSRTQTVMQGASDCDFRYRRST